MIDAIAEVPDLKETPGRMSQVRPQHLESLTILCKYERHLLTPTAPPVRQQVVALSAAALWPHEGVHTFVLAAMVSKAAVVDH